MTVVVEQRSSAHRWSMRLCSTKSDASARRRLASPEHGRDISVRSEVECKSLPPFRNRWAENPNLQAFRVGGGHCFSCRVSCVTGTPENLASWHLHAEAFGLGPPKDHIITSKGGMGNRHGSQFTYHQQSLRCGWVDRRKPHAVKVDSEVEPKQVPRTTCKPKPTSYV